MSSRTAQTTDHPERLRQGDVRLLGTDLAQQLLYSSIPARLAFVATDGTPRVVPTWFEWNGAEVVMVTYVAGPNAGIRHPAARIAALRANPAVALTIDTEHFPPQSLTLRGRAEIDEVDGLAPEYITSAQRYLGDAAADLIEAMDQPGTVQARIVVRPTWVGLLDFAARLPSPLGGV
jgi:Pyridoxamine 5'-phosphate oxidase